MKLEDQVTNLELSKQLKELGVEQESLFYWVEVKKGKWECWELIHLMQHWECCHMRNEKPINKISAFTVAELGEILPYYVELTKVGPIKMATIYSDYNPLCEDDVSMIAEKEADVRAKMLIYLIENNLIKNDRS
jgi:hypothetical protein